MLHWRPHWSSPLDRLIADARPRRPRAGSAATRSHARPCLAPTPTRRSSCAAGRELRSRQLQRIGPPVLSQLEQQAIRTARCACRRRCLGDAIPKNNGTGARAYDGRGKSWSSCGNCWFRRRMDRAGAGEQTQTPPNNLTQGRSLHHFRLAETGRKRFPGWPTTTSATGHPGSAVVLLRTGSPRATRATQRTRIAATERQTRLAGTDWQLPPRPRHRPGFKRSRGGENQRLGCQTEVDRRDRRARELT